MDSPLSFPVGLLYLYNMQVCPGTLRIVRDPAGIHRDMQKKGRAIRLNFLSTADMTS